MRLQDFGFCRPTERFNPVKKAKRTVRSSANKQATKKSQRLSNARQSAKKPEKSKDDAQPLVAAVKAAATESEIVSDLATPKLAPKSAAITRAVLGPVAMVVSHQLRMVSMFFGLLEAQLSAAQSLNQHSRRESLS